MEIRLLVEDTEPKDDKSALVFLSRYRVGNIPAKLQFRVDSDDIWKDVDIVFQSQLDKALRAIEEAQRRILAVKTSKPAASHAIDGES